MFASHFCSIFVYYSITRASLLACHVNIITMVSSKLFEKKHLTVDTQAIHKLPLYPWYLENRHRRRLARRERVSVVFVPRHRGRGLSACRCLFPHGRGAPSVLLLWLLFVVSQHALPISLSLTWLFLGEGGAGPSCC